MTTAPPASAPAATTSTAAFSSSDWAVFSAIGVIWGASFLFIAVGLESLEPGLITLLRVSLGALTLGLLPGSRVRLQPEDRPRMLALSMIWVALPFTLFPLAEQHINSAVAGLLNGAVPMFTVVFALLFFNRRTNGPQLLGLAAGFLGVVLISIPSLSAGSSQALGVLLVLLATVCYGLAINIAAPLQARYGSRAVMARMLALATVWTLPFGLASLHGSRVELPRSPPSPCWAWSAPAWPTSDGFPRRPCGPHPGVVHHLPDPRGVAHPRCRLRGRPRSRARAGRRSPRGRGRPPGRPPGTRLTGAASSECLIASPDLHAAVAASLTLTSRCRPPSPSIEARPAGA